MLKNYKDLKVWRASYQLCLDIYKLTRKYPSQEKYGLVTQIRRASLSVPSNIAEGYSRKQLAEYIHFLRIAYGSLAELETQSHISYDLNYLKAEDFKKLSGKVMEVERMLSALINSLKRKLDALKP